jgi:hypothetical protein
MAQAVDCLICKHEALIANPSFTKKTPQNDKKPTNKNQNKTIKQKKVHNPGIYLLLFRLLAQDGALLVKPLKLRSLHASPLPDHRGN